jgi:3-methyl-2-oxobutanoate hydroxymethyltransferase
MLTAYDDYMAKLSILLVLMLSSLRLSFKCDDGHETTLPITLDQMIHHASSVVRAIERSLVVVDLPFGSYQSDPKRRCTSIRIMKESGGHAVKLEGGKKLNQ